jgi:phosphoglucomutase
MSKNNITFGTSGHRGIIGDTFSHQHVTAISLAIADYLRKNKENPIVVIGYDPRTGNSPDLEESSFTKVITDILTLHGIDVHFFDSVSPTPLVSWYIKKYKLDGGIILTASHNPAEYNGIKFNPANGAPAPTEVTKELEQTANFYFDNLPILPNSKKGTIKIINKDKEFTQDLLNNCLHYCDTVNTVFSDTSIVIDAKHGAVSSIWENILAQLKISNYEIIHKEPRADFDNIEPNPTKLNTLDKLRDAQKQLSAPIAFANDPDGDRHVILDENGQALTPEETTTIIMDFFINNNVAMLSIGTTIASSMLIKSAARKNDLKIMETAVGFKYFAPLLEEATQLNKISLAVESSGGFTASFHTYEKCGFLPCILLMFISAKTNTSVSELKNKILDKYGKTFFLESEFQFPQEQKTAIINFFLKADKDSVKQFFSMPIQEIIQIDGLKIILENEDWVLLRLSGTEPLARIYAEAKEKEKAKELISIAKNLLSNI